MRVFLSWSGETSRAVAQAMREWLPDVIHSLEPFMSEEDIEKGARGLDVIGRELKESAFGIICVTEPNMVAPWLLFEAGALSKSLDEARVVPLLFDVSYKDIAPPLRQFQATRDFTKPELRKLVSSINENIGDAALPKDKLDKSFDKWWPDLERSINEVRANSKATLPINKPQQQNQSEVLLKESIEIGRATLQMLSDFNLKNDEKLAQIVGSVAGFGQRNDKIPGALIYDLNGVLDQLEIEIESTPRSEPSSEIINSSIRKLKFLVSILAERYSDDPHSVRRKLRSTRS